MNRMRVAFVSFDFGEYCIRIARALSTEADVRLYLPECEVGPHRRLLENSKVELHEFRKPRLRHAFKQMRTVCQLLKSIRRFDPDVIHLQSGHFWFNLGLPFLRSFPLVLTVHDPKPHLGDRGSRNTPDFVIGFGFRSATRLIVHAPQLRAELLKRVSVAESAISVIPHVALGDSLGPGPGPGAELRAESESHNILFFGRIWPYKGLDVLIRAEPLITAEIPAAKIVIAGTGEDFSRYRAMMQNPEHFEVRAEYISDEERSELFRNASLVVLPYVEASQSGVIPLAYRFGKPVVASNVGGLPAMVDHGVTGFLVPPRDSASLAAAVIRLLRNRNMRLEMGANAMRKVDTECSPERVARDTLAVYREAMNPHPPGRRKRLPASTQL
ncbi:MAG: glycosyl transferase group 1 [Bryobacterales bacterium]|nr:glycosyl transferase group 1 [Bryobacterales bacterium]